MRELHVEVAMDLQAHGIGIYNTSDPLTRTIFTGEVPTDLKNAAGDVVPLPEAIWIVNVPSPPPHQYLPMEYTVLDFWARSPHSDRSVALLRQVLNLMHRRHHWQTTNWYIEWTRALGGIVDVDRDRENGKLFRLSVQFICRNLNQVS